MKMKNIMMMIVLMYVGVFVFSACSSDNEVGEDIITKNVGDDGNLKVKEEIIYKVGVITPLTGDAAVYGQAVQRVYDKALLDINTKWKNDGENKKIEIYFEDGKCSPKDSLTAAQSLVNIKGVNVILGGGCSGETLGAAAFAEGNEIIMLSPLSSSPEITNAGDYIFRNVGSDSYQASIAAKHIFDNGYKKIAIISENTDYAQDLRKTFILEVEKSGGEIVADEIVDTNQRDLKTQILKIKNTKPEVVFINPQSPVTAKVFIKHVENANLKNVNLYGNEILAVGDTLVKDTPDGTFVFRAKFDEENTKFKKLIEITSCDLGLYCATSYDGLLLMSEIFEVCGDDDTRCIKNKLYNTQNWKGEYQGEISFDKNGDISVEFETFKAVNGVLVRE